MQRIAKCLIVIATAGAMGCVGDSQSPTSYTPQFSPGGKGGGKPTDPTATWFFPLDDAGLALRSDGQFADDGYSVYADGVCGVSTRIFATTVASNSGDATLQTDQPKRGCGRRFTLVYPDGGTESVRSFLNVRNVQNTTTSIPLGATEQRTFAINPGALANNPSRCGRIVFGQNQAGTVGVGTDSVHVTRLDARTWRVFTAEGRSRAMCEELNEIYEMPVDFVIVASRELPH